MAKFVFKPDYEYWWPVKVKVPNADPKRGGGMIEQTFNAKFRSISTTVAADLMKDGEEGTTAFIKAVIADWDESVVDDDGAPVPFSDGALADMIGNVWALRAFWTAWSESINVSTSAKK